MHHSTIRTANRSRAHVPPYTDSFSSQKKTRAERHVLDTSYLLFPCLCLSYLHVSARAVVTRQYESAPSSALTHSRPRLRALPLVRANVSDVTRIKGTRLVAREATLHLLVLGLRTDEEVLLARLGDRANCVQKHERMCVSGTRNGI